MKSIVIYQAYGQTAILEQTLFSIVSLFKRHLGLSHVDKIVIYTDNPEYFKAYLGEPPVMHYEDMSASRLKEWRGEINFIHRVKVEMLKNAANLFPMNNLFYMDGDTYFEQDPSHLMAQIGPYHSIMHEAENVIDMGKDPLSKKIARFLRRQQFEIHGKKIKIPTATMMWNAGVLGFCPQFFPELEAVLSFTDQSYSKYQKHIMEQLAFSYFLASKTRIHSAQEYVHHYWRQKTEFGSLITDFLARTKNLERGLSEFDNIDWPAPPAPKKGFLKRTLDKLIT
jgi:hypothetical protein